MNKLIKTLGLLGILASSVLASDSNPNGPDETQQLTNLAETSSYQSLSSDEFSLVPLDNSRDNSESDNNKEYLSDEPEKVGCVFLPLKNRTVAIGLRIATNIIIPAGLIAGGYYLTIFIYNSNVAYYSSPNFHPDGEQCHRLETCGCYGQQFTLSPNDPIPSIHLPTIQNQCNLSDATVQSIGKFFESQLKLIGEFWNYPVKTIYSDSLCIQDDYARGEMYAQRLRNSIKMHTGVSHYFPECLASNSPSNYWIPAGTIIFGITAMVGINILFPGCLY